MVVYGSGNRRRVADYPKIELDASAGPGSPHGDIPKFDHIVGVNEWFIPGLVPGPPDFPTDFGCNQYPDMFIFELHQFPTVGASLRFVTIKSEIRIDSTGTGNRIGI